MAKRFLVLTALLMLGFFIAGCAEGDKSASVTNPNPDPFAPTGSISGVVFDYCSNMPVKGATVSVGFSGKTHKVVTAADGTFSFDNVPANYGYNYYYGSAQTGNDYMEDAYMVVCDLTSVKDNPYKYSTVMPAWVTYEQLRDGVNDVYSDSSSFTESGSGASTPVHKLASSVSFAVAKPTATIKVTVADRTPIELGTTGAFTAAPIAADSVLLYKRLWIDRSTSESNPDGEYLDYYIGAFTADTTVGSYTYANVVPLNNTGYLTNFEGEQYYVQVIKAGYKTGQGHIDPSQTCIGLPLTCQPGCGQTVSSAWVVDYDPSRDTTAPVVTSIVVPGGPEADASGIGGGSIYGDVITPTATSVTPFATIVLSFNEAMNDAHTIKNAIRIYDEFSVTLTSAGGAGTGPHGADYIQTVDVDILDRSTDYTDFTLAYDTAKKVLTLTPKLAVASVLAADGNAETASWHTHNADGTITWNVLETVVYNSGAWEVRLSDGNSDMIFDASLNGWAMDSDSELAYWQQNFLFTDFSQLGAWDGDSNHWFFWIGQGNVKADFDFDYED